MDILLLLACIVTVFVTYHSITWLILFLTKVGLIVKDQNKKDRPLIPISGGLAVLIGFLVGILLYVIINTFYVGTLNWSVGSSELTIILASVIAIIWVTLVGFFDDAFIHGSNEKSLGLGQIQKPLLTLLGAIPLMIVLSERATLFVPYLGDISVGWIYPLILIPIGFVGATNMVNMLAGLNGVEAGMGAVYLFSLGMYAYVHQIFVASLIAFVALSAVLVFWYFNKMPAKIFPGDSLTYFLGGTLATIAIVGGLEFPALIISIPFLVEFLLKWRSNFSADTFGIWINGKILSKYEKVYSIIHLFTRTGNYTEKQITNYLIAMQVFFSVIIWLI